VIGEKSKKGVTINSNTSIKKNGENPSNGMVIPIIEG
jgi:hypothetical protein